MPHVTPEQTRKLGTYPLTRDGLDVPNSAAMTPAACWNFALTGTVLNSGHVQAPEQIYKEILNVEAFAENVLYGLQDTATAANHPGCAPYLATLNTQIENAMDGEEEAQNAFQEAMVKIVAVKNGLTPCDDDRYKLHMKGKTWFVWDHWALSLKPQQPGRPRIFIQTVTGAPLRHACDCIWDEDLTEVSINIQQLHATQVGFINQVADYGNLCVVCGAGHGPARSGYFGMWHRCLVCRAVYCNMHGMMLGGKRFNERTRACSRPNCNGRTELLDMV